MLFLILEQNRKIRIFKVLMKKILIRVNLNKSKSKRKTIKIKKNDEISSTFIKLAKMPFHVGLTGQCLIDRNYIVCEDIKGNSIFSQDIDNFKGLTQLNNLMVVPFYSSLNSDTPIGIIQCANTRSRKRVTEYQIEVANALKGFLSSCVDNIDTFEISLFKIKVAIEGCRKVLPDLK